MEAPRPAISPAEQARPFGTPPELKLPPAPSIWPLVGLGLLALSCLGGGLGVLFLLMHWVHGALSAASQMQASPPPTAVQPQDPFAAPRIPQRPPGQPLEPLDPAKIQEEIRETMRRMEEQFARNAQAVDPPLQLPPWPEMGKPGQELPPLKFEPADLAPLGRETHGDHVFEDIAPAGGWLVGLRITKGRPWNGAIVALQPIYQAGDTYQLGESCGSGQQEIDRVQYLARPGYAISKIEVREGLALNALRVEFRRVDGESLAQNDSYVTDWFGAEGGGPHSLDGDSSPIVGLAGGYQPNGEIVSIQALRKKP